MHTLRLALEPLLQVASVCPFAVLDPPPPTLCLFLPFFAMAHVRTLRKRANKRVGCSSEFHHPASDTLSGPGLRLWTAAVVARSGIGRPQRSLVDRCSRCQEWRWRAAAMSNAELWMFLAAAEEGEEAFAHLEEAGVLRRRPSAEEETAPPRPGSALRDRSGRRMVYGNPNFRFAQIGERDRARAQDKNEFEGTLRGGLPHGFGTKVYSVAKQWHGRLWPFGTIHSDVIEGQVVRYKDYLQEIGLIRRCRKPIIFVEGKHVVRSMLDISRIMERLKLENGTVVALIITVLDEQVFQDVGFHAKHSAYLESWKGPVICVVQGQFEFEPFTWPLPLSVKARIPALKLAFAKPWLEDNWWEMHAEPTMSPPTLTLRPEGRHHLDHNGVFPIVPVGQFRTILQWDGHEVYVGEFKEGVKHGKGLFLRTNGDKHAGYYSGGIANGRGVYHWKNGNMFVGSWLHGKKEPRGKVYTREMQLAATLVQRNFRMQQARTDLDMQLSKQKMTEVQRARLQRLLDRTKRIAFT